MELADMFVHMIFPRKALGAFTSASIYGTICERRRMHNYMVPLQVGWASETTSAYITYSNLWSWQAGTRGRERGIVILKRQMVIEALIGIGWQI
jgi:hypothetical protein